MEIIQIILQVIFFFITIIIGILSGRSLCVIAPEEIKQGKIWAKLILKILFSIMIITIISFSFLNFKNILFITEFLLFLIAMMFGIIIYFKDE